ncbi:MAG: type II secretion system F family protein [Alphaproteobacteria bacterium]|jgi:tight adherence protein B|nr:type II secretion system F family protein [Alphaproteobacteria bacterium]MDP6874404.1 type II secretion system F family protein [Alphaproteobacteria bacterium]
MDLGILVFVVAGAVFMSMTVLTFILVMPQIKARANLKQRVAIASGKSGTVKGARAGRGETGGRKRDIQSRLRELEEAKTKKSFAVKMRETLRQAGLRTSLRNYFLLCVVLSIVSAVVYVLLGCPGVGVLPVAITVGFGLPRYVVASMSKRRVNKFTKEFANAVDVIVRGIKSGLPVGECLNVIATESPEPVAGVFREIVESQKLGLSLDLALERAQEQMKTAEMQFFAIVLAIQAQTGGNLADTLQNLSNILRDRKKMADKVKALSSEAKSSAGIIGSLPFLMTALLYLVSPEYITPLFVDDLGHILIGGGLVWMSMGVFIMKQMINFEV